VKRLVDPPYICLITEGLSDPTNFQSEKKKILTTIRDAVSDGVNMVQIREKSLPARLLFDLVRDAVEILRDTSSIVLVNDRVDIALAAGADGVHLRESSLLPFVVRVRFPRQLIVGVSTHSYSAAKSAAWSNADYVVFGPVFMSPGKQSPVAESELRAVCLELEGFPVLALGGVDAGNVIDVLKAGASGIAAIRSLNEPASRSRICESIASYYSSSVE
jgi:thiamine-phosphate diphosphorylase